MVSEGHGIEFQVVHDFDYRTATEKIRYGSALKHVAGGEENGAVGIGRALLLDHFR